MRLQPYNNHISPGFVASQTVEFGMFLCRRSDNFGGRARAAHFALKAGASCRSPLPQRNCISMFGTITMVRVTNVAFPLLDHLARVSLLDSSPSARGFGSLLTPAHCRVLKHQPRTSSIFSPRHSVSVLTFSLSNLLAPYTNYRAKTLMACRLRYTLLVTLEETIDDLMVKPPAVRSPTYRAGYCGFEPVGRSPTQIRFGSPLSDVPLLVNFRRTVRLCISTYTHRSNNVPNRVHRGV